MPDFSKEPTWRSYIQYIKIGTENVQCMILNEGDKENEGIYF